MRIAFVGCGYVFDIYMRTYWAYPEIEICGVFDIDEARAAVVSQHYGIHRYPNYEALLSDERVEIVVNLTSIRSHYETVRLALEAGKHVYSEKPLTTDVDETRALFDLAAKRGLALSAAPSNIYSDSIATIWKALRENAVGKPVLVYAELDDNPAHLMNLETVQSPTGAPFPYVEELQEGCTVEHVAYHLVWMCALFGPVTAMTAFSKALVAHKTDTPLDPSDTPDFSVACLNFAGGVAARVTCSWVAPRDHSFKIIGETGQITADNIFHDQSVVKLEHFSRTSLAARKIYSIRNQPVFGSMFGVDGHKLPLLRRWKSHAVEAERGVGTSLKHRLVSWLRRRQVYAQDKLLGVAEMARAIAENRPQPLSPDFLMHLNEVTLLIRNAGMTGSTVVPTTSFEPLSPLSEVTAAGGRDLSNRRGGVIERLVAKVVETLHRR